VKLPAYKAGLQNNIFINDNSICIPLIGQGLGEIFKEIIRKIPLSKGGDMMQRELFIPVYKTGYSSSFFIKNQIYF
jgi:hypothetical protein